MVGRDVELIVPKGPAKPGEVVLKIEQLLVRDDRLEMAVNGVDLEVRAGEIVAIAGSRETVRRTRGGHHGPGRRTPARSRSAATAPRSGVRGRCPTWVWRTSRRTAGATA